MPRLSSAATGCASPSPPMTPALPVRTFGLLSPAWAPSVSRALWCSDAQIDATTGAQVGAP